MWFGKDDAPITCWNLNPPVPVGQEHELKIFAWAKRSPFTPWVIYGELDSCDAGYSSHNELYLCYGSKGRCLLVSLHQVNLEKQGKVTDVLNDNWNNRFDSCP